MTSNGSSATPLPPILQEALAASQGNDSARAITLLTQAIQRFPQAAIPHYLLAAEYAQQRRYAEAETSFSNALIVEPTFHIARFQLGLLQFSSGHAAPALLTWQPLLDLPDGTALRMFVEGFAYLAQDQFPEALERFGAGMDANRDNAPLNGDIAQIVAEIHKVMAANAAQSGGAADAINAAQGAQAQPATHTAQTSTSADHHILLTAYQQSETRH